MSSIRRAVVIGAGTMGSGIASHLANVGVIVHLLDLPSDGPNGRNATAESALARMLKSQPPAFFHPDAVNLVTAGNTEDDLHRVSEADWIAEAVVERLDVKEALYKSIEQYRRPGTAISSNTSTIPLSMLTRNMSETFCQDFCITHFFNPVRYMRLLEIVKGPRTRSEVIGQLTDFCDRRLGKGIVLCRDTPGFLGNRVGVFAVQLAIVEAIRSGLTVEEADAVLGRPLGWPKTGVFRLYDLIGLDLMLDVLASMRAVLPEDDPFYAVAEEVPLIRELVNRGCTGNKGGGGFYRASSVGLEVVDLVSGEYRTFQPPSHEAIDAGLRDGLRALLAFPDAHGRFAWRVLSQTLCYAANLIPTVADEPAPIDEAMKLGFNWTRGPFELIDALGVDWFADRLRADSQAVPDFIRAAEGGSFYAASAGQLQQLGSEGGFRPLRRAEGTYRLSDRKHTSSACLGNEVATLWDIGDGVACFEFHTKANAIVPATMELLDRAVDVVAERFRALVIHNDGPHFSVGVNIQFVLDQAHEQNWTAIEQMLLGFQLTCKKLKYAPFPVVGAPSGMALGGGYEVLLHCDSLVAHCNTVLGLVETKVGLVPSGGGCKEMLARWSSELPPPDCVARVFEIIGPATTAASHVMAEPFRFVRDVDQSIMNRDRILPAAMRQALALAENYQPPSEVGLPAAGSLGMQGIEQQLEAWQSKGVLAPHDITVGRELGQLLCGGDAAEGTLISEDQLFALERDVFLSLVQTPQTLARIEHTLRSGKPLRN